MSAPHEPRVTSLGRGRALHIGQRGELFVARRYAVHRSGDGGRTWERDCFIPDTGWKPLVARTRLACRLLRYYIAAFEILPDGSRIAVARDGIHRAGPGETAMKRVHRYDRGSRPLNLAVDGVRVLFGEYGNLDEHEVRIYHSEDGGRTFEVGYQFPRGDVRHIHNVLFDARRNHFWVLAGDFDRQPGIAALSRDLKHLEWLSRGRQEFRAVGAILMPDCLVYGTDSDRERNFILRMDKESGRVERLREVEGSSLYASTFGSIHVISTNVEPNPACPSRECSLYASRDGVTWERCFVQRKDLYGFKYFQFGTIVLPRSQSADARGLCSGQALAGADDMASVLDWTAD